MVSHRRMVSRDKPIAYHATKDQDVRQLSMNSLSQTYGWVMPHAYACVKWHITWRVRHVTNPPRGHATHVRMAMWQTHAMPWCHITHVFCTISFSDSFECRISWRWLGNGRDIDVSRYVYIQTYRRRLCITSRRSKWEMWHALFMANMFIAHLCAWVRCVTPDMRHHSSMHESCFVWHTYSQSATPRRYERVLLGVYHRVLAAIGIHTQNMFDTDTLVYINVHVCRWR